MIDKDRDADTGSGEPDATPSQFDWTRRRPSVAVVEAVAAITDRDPTTVPHLHRYVDPDALNALVEGSAGDGGANLRVSFTYDGIAVTVGGDGTVEVRAQSE